MANLTIKQKALIDVLISQVRLQCRAESRSDYEKQAELTVRIDETLAELGTNTDDLFEAFMKKHCK